MPLKNINIGILGHVDSGKTSLARILSNVKSTAAFDKSPISQERGITLDLGFSALKLESNDKLLSFIDCPGHQSLIKTILGGSQIIDMMILVLDIQKGFETQTAECLILGEILGKPMIIALNKIDLIHEEKHLIDKMKKKILKTLESTIFKNSEIVSISASKNLNIEALKLSIIRKSEEIELRRNNDGSFIFAFDHCFAIKGSGTIFSGTVLQGGIKVNETVEIPDLKLERKVKSMQIFKEPVSSGSSGDRIGICVTNFDANLLERGLLCQHSSVIPASAIIIQLKKIRYYKRVIKSKSKFHCSIGHETAIGNLLLFSSDYSSSFSFDANYSYEEFLDEVETKTMFALIDFENPVMIHDKMMLIGFKLDTVQTNGTDRLAFYGEVSVKNSSMDKNFHQKLKIFKMKCREGNVQRVVNSNEVISSNLFKKETDRSKFIGLNCKLSTGEIGTIIGSFGQSAKVRISFANPLELETIEKLKNPRNDIKILLQFKSYIYDKSHRMVQ